MPSPKKNPPKVQTYPENSREKKSFSLFCGFSGAQPRAHFPPLRWKSHNNSAIWAFSGKNLEILPTFWCVFEGEHFHEDFFYVAWNRHSILLSLWVLTLNSFVKSCYKIIFLCGTSLLGAFSSWWNYLTRTCSRIDLTNNLPVQFARHELLSAVCSEL